MKFIDRTGQRFGRLVVLDVATREPQTKWRVRCDCGAERVVWGSHLVAGNTTSCGCYARELPHPRLRHGHWRGRRATREHSTWNTMIQRCTNPKASHYAEYGGRGIRVCDRWLESFENFYADMGPKPPGLTLDRRDNDGNYEPANCRWATWTEQRANQRPRKARRCIGE